MYNYATSKEQFLQWSARSCDDKALTQTVAASRSGGLCVTTRSKLHRAFEAFVNTHDLNMGSDPDPRVLLLLGAMRQHPACTPELRAKIEAIADTWQVKDQERKRSALDKCRRKADAELKTQLALRSAKWQQGHGRAWVLRMNASWVANQKAGIEEEYEQKLRAATAKLKRSCKRKQKAWIKKHGSVAEPSPQLTVESAGSTHLVTWRIPGMRAIMQMGRTDRFSSPDFMINGSRFRFNIDWYDYRRYSIQSFSGERMPRTEHYTIISGKGTAWSKTCVGMSSFGTKHSFNGNDNSIKNCLSKDGSLSFEVKIKAYC